jgi:SAM-dependent methyltransferase
VDQAIAKTFNCPFCGHTATEFLAYGVVSPVFQECRIVGGGFRKNAKCPSCGSLDRERLLLLYLQRQTAVFSCSPRILHVAPEPHLGQRLKAASVNYLSIDLAPQRAMLQADICAIPFADSAFDLVVCNHVLEHIEEDQVAIAELFRVTASGGVAILQVPLALALSTTREGKALQSDKDREDVYGQSDHVRIYAIDYIQRLERAGFRVRVYDPDEESGIDLRNRYALMAEEKVYIGIK